MANDPVIATLSNVRLVQRDEGTLPVVEGPARTSVCWSIVNRSGDGETVPTLAPYDVTLTRGIAKASTAATATAVYTVRKGATLIATISFAGSALSGTVIINNGEIEEGDILTLHAPATADATLANLAILLKG